MQTFSETLAEVTKSAMAELTPSDILKMDMLAFNSECVKKAQKLLRIRESLAPYGMNAEIVNLESGQFIEVSDAFESEFVLTLDSECYFLKGELPDGVCHEINSAVRKFL